MVEAQFQANYICKFKLFRTRGQCWSKGIRRQITRVRNSWKTDNRNSLYGSIAPNSKFKVIKVKTNSIYFQIIEPLGSVKPKVASKAVESIEHPVNSTFNLLCIGQAFPIPVYR